MNEIITLVVLILFLANSILTYIALQRLFWSKGYLEMILCFMVFIIPFFGAIYVLWLIPQNNYKLSRKNLN